MKRVSSIFFCVIVALNLSACGEKTSVSNAPAIAIPDEGSQGAVKFRTNCSNCHGVPQPSVHKADEWPNVVDRMETHRILRSFGSFTDEDRQEIISYLQKYAAQ